MKLSGLKSESLKILKQKQKLAAAGKKQKCKRCSSRKLRNIGSIIYTNYYIFFLKKTYFVASRIGENIQYKNMASIGHSYINKSKEYFIMPVYDYNKDLILCEYYMR